jgi:hypothetical protein
MTLFTFRFELRHVNWVEGMQEPDLAHVASWATWEEAEAAWDDTGRIPSGHQLRDKETGRTWYPGARYDWEDCLT